MTNLLIFIKGNVVGVFCFVLGAFSGILRTTGIKIKNALIKNFINNKQNQNLSLILYLFLFITVILWYYSVMVTLFFFLLQFLIYLFYIYQIKKKTKLESFLFFYVLYVQYFAFNICMKTMNILAILFVFWYCCFFLYLYQKNTKFWDLNFNVVDYHYDMEFESFKVLKFLNGVNAICVITVIRFCYCYSIFVNQQLMVFYVIMIGFIALNLLYLSLIDLTILFCCNPKSSKIEFGITLGKIGLNALAVNMIGHISNVVPYGPVFDVPYRRELQQAQLGFTACSAHEKNIGLKFQAFFPYEKMISKSETNTDIDGEATEKLFKEKMRKELPVYVSQTSKQIVHFTVFGDSSVEEKEK